MTRNKRIRQRIILVSKIRALKFAIETVLHSPFLDDNIPLSSREWFLLALPTLVGVHRTFSYSSTEYVGTLGVPNKMKFY